MTTPRIEEVRLKARKNMIDIVTTDSRHLEILDEALTEAHQAGIDEAVEIVKSVKPASLPDSYSESDDIISRNDTIKALQDNK